MKRMLLAFGIVALIGCSDSGGGLTGPSVTSPEPVSVETETPAEVPVVTPEGTGHTAYHISQDGTVVNSGNDAVTACVYNATIDHNQTLIMEYVAGVGRTPLPYSNDDCDPLKIQVDLLEAQYHCPQVAGPFQGFLGGLRITLPGKPCPKPTPSPTPSPTPPPICEPGDWKVISEERSDTEWGECQTTTAAVSASCQSKCSQQGTYTITTVEDNGCEKRTTTKTKFEYRKCDCPPPPKGICHVSNKGYSDGNWNLQVSYHANGEGHEAHLTDPKFCPNDFEVESRWDCGLWTAYRLAENCPR